MLRAWQEGISMVGLKLMLPESGSGAYGGLRPQTSHLKVLLNDIKVT